MRSSASLLSLFTTTRSIPVSAHTIASASRFLRNSPRISVAAMSSSTRAPENDTSTSQSLNPESHDDKTQQKPILALPEAPSSDATHQIDLSDGAGTAKLDHLGPLVVNADGTLSRIGNWAQMTELERTNTLRVLGKRNQARLKALREQRKAQQGEGEGGK